MVAIEQTTLFPLNNIPPSPLPPSSSSKFYSPRKIRNKYIATFAKKKIDELSENKQPIFPLKPSNPILFQTAIAVFGLGFIDAGYSGDWSRIGVISKESEDLLKIAAFVVIPLCIFLVISISRQEQP